MQAALPLAQILLLKWAGRNVFPLRPLRWLPIFVVDQACRAFMRHYGVSTLS